MLSIIIHIIIIAIGFMMAVLYKRSNTSAQILNPEPQRLVRYYRIVFVTAVLVSGFLAWLTADSIDSSLPSIEVSMQYQNKRSIMVFVLHFLFLALMVLANLQSQAKKKIAFASYLSLLLFYAGFAMLDSQIITLWYYGYQTTNDIQPLPLADFQMKMKIKTAMACIAVFINVGMIWWSIRE